VLIPVTLRSTVSTLETSISPPLISTIASVLIPETTRLESAAPTILTLAIVAIPVTFKLPVSIRVTSISPALISAVARVVTPTTFKLLEISTESLIST
jgi:hypothetical protein